MLVSCSGPSANDTVSYTFPSSMGFDLVSPVLEIRCGTLDCHGSIYRNMRIFGHYGARLSSSDSTGNQLTSDAEIQRNYESVTAIDPENLATIVAKHGQGFDNWMVVLKGENAVEHKGGARMKKGDDTYNCLLSWVNGAVDMNACTQAAMLMAPMTSASAPSDGTPPASTPSP
jgi:hypothetical protein